MYATEPSDSETDRTAFRKAEKKYKLYYYDHSTKKKKKPRAVDLSEVVDFQAILESFNSCGELPCGISLLQSAFHRPVFCLENHPGFYFIPGGISIEEQCHWIRESLFSFPQPPNRTNHNAIYGPISDLFIAAREKKVLVEDNILDQAGDVKCNGYDSNLNGSRWEFCEQCRIPGGNLSKSVQASLLLRKLRWSTLGLQFDWSKRNYNVSLPHKKIPASLSQLAKRLAAPAMPMDEEFQPEAAIVNYFASGDTLGGHLDDMEEDWSKPIVSMSLGCKAIFLLGGKSRLDEPFAMFLRSGDVVLMAGEARECFHGVPRIFTDEENAEITELKQRLSDEDDLCYLEYIRTSRININIRQVY